MARIMFYRSAALALALVVAATAQTPSPPPSPDPADSAAARAFFDQSQSGKVDRSTLALVFNSQLTPEMVTGMATGLQQSGKVVRFVLIASRASTSPPGTGYEYRVSLSRGGDLNYFVALSPEHKVLGALFGPYRPRQHLTKAQLVDQLHTRLAKAALDGRFSGAVLVAQNGTAIFQQAYGLADRAHHTPNTLQTRFRIGSMNKMFTAVAIMQLIAAGKMTLSDPIGKYLPQYPNREIATKVTIENLLTHTGGTGDFFGPVFDAHTSEFRTLEDYVKFFGTRGPAFEPGSKFEYSNYGFILLGLAVASASGENYYDYVRKHIYEPAGMTSTGSEPEDVAVPNRSIGYTDEDGKIVPNTPALPYRGTSAGGGYTTVGDMLHFANALQSHVLLDAASVALMTTGKIRMPSMPDTDQKYGFGFGDQTANGVRCFGHSGGSRGMSGSLLICPVPGYVVVALANIDPPAAENVTDYVIDNMPLK